MTSPRLPAPRGPLSAFLLEHLSGEVVELPPPPPADGDPWTGEDGPLALYACYELHYRGFAGVDDRWEWEPSLLRLRRRLEDALLQRLTDEIGGPRPVGDAEAAVHRALAAGGGPSLSAHVASDGTLDEVREFAVHRSAYQLKEADCHTWAIPRLVGGPKAALVTIQADEYGNGVEPLMHASLFADTLAALGLDARYGAYLDVIPGVTLSTINLVSLFGLHRRWRGALVGHLAIFEMASVTPMSRYAAALRRLGMGDEAARFYDTHVVADAEHEVIAARDLAGGLGRLEPQLAGDIEFGARAIMAVEERFSRHLLGSWASGATSLLTPVEPLAPAVA